MEPGQVGLRNTRLRRVRSEIADHDYLLHLYVPDEEPPPGGFPILYMLDANSSFLTLAQTLAVLSVWRDSTAVRPMVIVGIGYDTDRLFDAERRALDYTVPEPPGGPEQAYYRRLDCAMGGADRFLAFIEDELKPLVEAEYPVDRRRQALFGHSFGGLFALYALFTRPGSFGTYVSASPSITWGLPGIRREEEAFARRRLAAGDRLRLLVTAGEHEATLAPYEREGEGAPAQEVYLREFLVVERARALVDRLNGLGHTGLHAEFREFAGEGHMSLVPTSAGHSLRFVCGGG